MTGDFWLGTPINDNEIYDAAMREIGEAFKACNHSPSKEHWKGIDQIVKVIEGMALRVHESPETPIKYKEFTPTFYLSSLPCGMGKTTAMIETVKALLKLDYYKPVSFIIFLSRRDEIEAIVQRMGLDNSEYACLTSDETINKKYGDFYNRDNVRVLFTTQAMLESRCHDGNTRKQFKDISDFYYQGKPRQVKIWDEAILPASVFTLKVRKLQQTIVDLENINRNLATEVDEWCRKVAALPDNSLIDVPVLEHYNVSVQQASNEMSHEDYKPTIEALYSLQGLTVRVVKDNTKGSSILQYADVLPNDLAPMLILDASGQVRTTYKLWQYWRKGLQPLYSPIKTYEGFNVYHWDIGAGKDAQRKNYGKISEGIAKTIDEAIPPKEKVLVVHYVPSKKQPDMAQEISKLCATKARVSFTTWGRHTSSNEFRDYENVILVGVLQYSPAQYEAHGLSSKAQDPLTPLPIEEREDVRKGEIRHHILQAACRGKVRYAVDGKCPDGCKLFIVFSGRDGIDGEEITQDVFPKSEYSRWVPIKELTGKKKVIGDYLANHVDKPVAFKTLRTLAGNMENYRLVQYLPEIADWLIEVKGFKVYIENETVTALKDSIPRPF